MTAFDMAMKLKGMADSDRNNLNRQDRMFLKEVANELMRGKIIQNGTNNTARQNTRGLSKE